MSKAKDKAKCNRSTLLIQVAIHTEKAAEGKNSIVFQLTLEFSSKKIYFYF